MGFLNTPGIVGGAVDPNEMGAMIEVNEDLVGTWYVVLDNQADFLIGLKRMPPGSDWDYQLDWRFRYYKDDLTGPESNDEKVFYRAKVKRTEVLTNELKIINQVRKSTNQLWQIGGFEDKPPVELLMDDEGPEGFARRLQEQEFSHATVHKIQ